MKIDLLAIVAHPDDAELSCGAILAKHKALGFSTGIVDLTRGELGTRGSAQLREQEAKTASEALNLNLRQNLGFKDGFFTNDKDHQLTIVETIRTYRPNIIITNAPEDRHPDHGRACQLVTESVFLSGLRKIKTSVKGNDQEAWRPAHLYHMIQSIALVPDFIVDTSDVWDIKMKAIKCYKSQFYDPSNTEPNTYISSPSFLKMIEARGVEFGQAIGVSFGEGLIKSRSIGVNSLYDIV